MTDLASLPGVRLYCLPYAGSSASGYMRWKRRLPEWIELVPVELPGRGRRMAEPLEDTFPELLERVAASVSPGPAERFALFGHSLGAMLAFELARRLEQQARAPLAVFVSAARAPSARDPARYEKLETDEELRAELQRLDGTPSSVLSEPELMALTLPVLRADFRVARSYAGSAERLHAPLVALGGAADESTREGFAAWRHHAGSEFSAHTLPGGHFFIQSSEAELLGIVERHLQRRRSGEPALSAPRPARAGGEHAGSRS